MKLLANFVKLGLAFWALVVSGAAVAEPRVALLIGNSAYQSGPLTNPPNDVREMEAALRAVGFKVDKLLNANQNAMRRAVRDFGDKAQGADIALLYYSGHGTQASGENYLIPVGADIHKEADYEIEAISANGIMRQISGAHPRAAIVVLDACRDNPFASATRGGPKGLGRMDAPTHTMIAFATAPNTTATDEGLYAKVLARQIKTPGLELLDVFRNTSEEVVRQTNGKQEPRVSEMSINERIYLAGRAGAPTQVASLEPQPVPAVVRVPTPAPTPLPVPTPVPTASPTPAPAQPSTPTPISTAPVLQDCPDCPRMLAMAGGSFTMGSDADVFDKPLHQVKINPFWLGQTHVTVGQWAAFANASHYQTEAERNAGGNKGCWSDIGSPRGYQPDTNWRQPGWAVTDDQPVVCISWNDAIAYVKWLSQSTGKNYRLPSESEWEYAARAGTRSAWSFGDDGSQLGDYAWYYNNSAKQAHPVAQKKPNPWGLYDMHGNAWQWVQDPWHANYVGAPADGSAWNTGGDASLRILRGGPWANVPGFLTSYFRYSYKPAARLNYFGFRVARGV